MATAAATRKYNALVAAGLKPRAYSGRAMYGKHCVGVRIERGDQSMPVVRGATFDSLGLGVIAYWPRLEWDDATMKEKED